MKRLRWPLPVLSAALLGFGVSPTLFPPAAAQQPAAKPLPPPQQVANPVRPLQPGPGPEKVPHARGHKTHPNIKQLIRRSALLHGPKLRRLRNITAQTWDCRTLGLVPPIVDQGQCGSCWDFSGTSVATSALMKALGKAAPGPLSEQYTLDCGSNGGCNGDDNITVLDWAKKTGLPTTADYGPYQASAGSCKAGVKLYQLQDWGFASTSDTQGVAATQDIKNAMVAYGPIGSGIDSSVLGDGTGIVSGSGNSIDHDIVLVGWDDTKGRAGCWILRNSWGTSWGVGGYCMIEYGAGSVGTEACWAVAAGAPTPPPTAPVISSAPTAAGTVGAAFSYQIVASNSPSAYDATGLPAGVTVNQTTGLLSGTPTAAGVSQVTLSAANTGGVGTAPLVITVTAPGPGPGPNPGPTAGITLTPDQVASVVQQAGAVIVPPGGAVVTPSMTFGEVMAALQKVADYKAKTEPPKAMPQHKEGRAPAATPSVRRALAYERLAPDVTARPPARKEP